MNRLNQRLSRVCALIGGNLSSHLNGAPGTTWNTTGTATGARATAQEHSSLEPQQ